MWNSVNFSDLEGKVISNIEQHDMHGDSIFIECTDGSEYLMKHEQDCCESVDIYDIDGDLQRLVGQKIISAYENSSSDDPDNVDVYKECRESFTWTFYVIRTNIDSVTIRWYGTSNGYYSESVDFSKHNKEKYFVNGEEKWI